MPGATRVVGPVSPEMMGPAKSRPPAPAALAAVVLVPVLAPPSGVRRTRVVRAPLMRSGCSRSSTWPLSVFFSRSRTAP